MRKALETVRFEEMKDKTFGMVHVIEKLCEFCGKPLEAEKRRVRTVHISNYKDYSNLVMRARAHDRVEVDLRKNMVYLLDHDYPGDVHQSCIERYGKG